MSSSETRGGTGRLGTCRHCFQIQEAYSIGDHPHNQRMRIDTSDHYTCQWLDSIKALPPPIKRMNGGFSLRSDDCDNCPHYEPPVWVIK